VSSEKQGTAAEVRGARGDTLATGTVTVVVDDYWRRTAPLKVSSRAAKVARMLGFGTPVRLYVYDTLLEWLAQDLEHMRAKLG